MADNSLGCKKHKHTIIIKIGIIILIIAVITMIGLVIWQKNAEHNAYYYPPYEKSDLHVILEKDTLTKEDFEQLYLQTGLSQTILEQLICSNQKDSIYEIQDDFFAVPKILCEMNSPISWEEKLAQPNSSGNLTDSNENSNNSSIQASNTLPDASNTTTNTQKAERKLIGFELGDILITTNSHTFGWRNGHAGIVVDVENRLTLEAVVLGMPSAIQSIDKWEDYPNIIVLRLKNATTEERKAIADYALNTFNNIPYGFYTDIFEGSVFDNNGKDTHCAHLLWKSFLNFGYNIDSNKGTLVTPSDIAKSPLLEVVQAYGVDLNKLSK